MSPRPQIEHIRKPQILTAAASVITERGLSATRIADVAERAGTSTSAVLYWFESREELLAEALIADEERWDRELDARLAAVPTASGKLIEIVEASVAEADWSLWIELWSRAMQDEGVAAARKRLDEAWRGKLEAVIAEGQRSGEFDAALDAGRIAAIAAALIDGLGVQVTLADAAIDGTLMYSLSIELLERELGVGLEETARGAAGLEGVTA